VNLRGEVAVHEVGHEVEVEDLPGGDVADGGDEGDQDAAGEGAAEGDLAVQVVVAVAADAEVDEQERRHHDGVAEQHAVAGPDLVGEQSELSIRTEIMTPAIRPKVRTVFFMAGSWCE